MLAGSLGFAEETQNSNFSQNLSPGEYVLGLTVVDDRDSTVSSALLVDNLEITPNSNQVPEPTTILALLTTVAAGTFVRTKK
jgi:hypothetical protein